MSKTEKAPKQRPARVFRGGSWYYDLQFARRAAPAEARSAPGAGGLGVRLVEVLDEQD
jgi:hypothetical protein